MTVEQQRHLFIEMRQFAEANDKVLPFDEMLKDAAFQEEISALASAAGVSIVEFGLAVNPNQYPAYSAASNRCRVDRYLARTGTVDIRVQVYTHVEFKHRLVLAPFRVVVLDGCLDIEREGCTMRLPADFGATVDGSSEVVLRASENTRFMYVDHPMTEWIRRKSVRK